MVEAIGNGETPRGQPDADRLFDMVHAVLLGPAAREGYHCESLASSDEPERHARLVAILALFSDVGWPYALKPMYDLPDLLR